ncbi:MAG: hypothetical protein HY653_00720, partial [Acidobacteria bacterium]|nr:hypothetical protein [Acidobacteriota bacterium]
VERKPASIGVHYRRARPAVVHRARRLIEQEWRRAGRAVRFQQGKKIWEFLPPGEASKATGARYLLARWRRGNTRPTLAFFLGDDEADEQVFRRLRGSLLSIAVGRSHTQADYRLPNPAAVGRFLHRLAEALRCA